jgi:hypothetical protein
MAKRPFSKRNKPAPHELTYELSRNVRERIFHNLGEIVQRTRGSLQGMFGDAIRTAYKEYGTLKIDPGRDEYHEVGSRHFMSCPPDEAIDFLEWLFGSQHYTSTQLGVDAVNEIFRQEGIGYEFSPYIVTQIQLPPSGNDPVSILNAYQSYRVEIQYPEATKKSNEVMHSTTVMPALVLLSGPLWTGADAEMLKAHEHFRNGNFADAIHWAGKCLESVLQTICEKRNWRYTPDVDTLNRLLQTCEKNGLYDAPYTGIIQQSSGTIRNKYGGHGKAQSETVHATERMAEHMIQITSAHVLFLAKLAGI